MRGNQILRTLIVKAFSLLSFQACRVLPLEKISQAVILAAYLLAGRLLLTGCAVGETPVPFDLPARYVYLIKQKLHDFSVICLK